MSKLKRSINRSDLRGGYTTGACAAAAARASVRMLLNHQSFSDIDIVLPNKENARFTLERLEKRPDANGSESVIAGIIKDAGDDPDCTHGIEIQCIAKWSSQSGIQLKGGEGVAKVTLPGLELTVGEAAINPVPRTNILEMAQLEIEQSGFILETKGIELIITVPQGEYVAKDTINDRLGLIGGISILGTRGTVKPYSTSAFAASVRQSIQIARANDLDHVLLTTGSRSEKAAMVLFPDLTEMAFIQAGDFMGIALRASKRYHLKKASMVVMIGKLGKLISGKMMTHVSGHEIDFQYLSQLAAQEGLSDDLCKAIATANTGRHVLDLVRKESSDKFLARLCKEAFLHASEYVNHALDIDVLLVDFDGSLLANYGGLCEVNGTNYE